MIIINISYLPGETVEGRAGLPIVVTRPSCAVYTSSGVTTRSGAAIRRVGGERVPVEEAVIVLVTDSVTRAVELVRDLEKIVSSPYSDFLMASRSQK